MAFFGDKINETVVVEKKSFEVIPAGWYTAKIEKCDYKDTSSGGGMLAMTFDIMGLEKVAKVFENYNILNSNPQTEGYARESLRSIESAAGLPKVTDTDQFIGATMEIKVKVTPAKGDWPERNSISDYRKPAGSVVTLPKLSPFGGFAK